MSAHFSKFSLNAYSGTPYFQSQIPAGYPLSLVLQKCRAFRRLPPNLKKLAALAKRWTVRKYPDRDRDIEQWYDSKGNELDPGTGRKLTDREIDAQWHPDPTLDAMTVTDIPVPEGGFADPDTWEEPEPAEEPGVWGWGRMWYGSDPGDIPSRYQLLWDIWSRGRAATADEYGIAEDLLPVETDDDQDDATLDFGQNVGAPPENVTNANPEG